MALEVLGNDGPFLRVVQARQTGVRGETLRDALAKRAIYRRTVREIEALPVDLAIEDMGLNPYEAKEIARRAVYGA